MDNKKVRKLRKNVTIDEYLSLCTAEISLLQYLELEGIRIIKLGHISPIDWTNLIQKQLMRCYYCETELVVIQQLIVKGILNPRKRGPDSYSGLHFELDHKNCDNSDNRPENLVASCYYCNNDRSNTIPSDIFKQYFGLQKKAAFSALASANALTASVKFRHHLSGRTTTTKSAL